MQLMCIGHGSAGAVTRRYVHVWMISIRDMITPGLGPGGTWMNDGYQYGI